MKKKKDPYYEELKKSREKYFGHVADYVYGIFSNSEFFDESSDYFEEHASYVIDELRKRAWENYYQKKEKEFTIEMLKRLINVDKEADPVTAVTEYAVGNIEKIYMLNLSNTQSRRIHAGSEFESIVELVMLWAGVPVDCQANIGLERFTSKGLGKQCDMLFPSLHEYNLNKSKGAFISLKTTLRERHGQVSDEVTTTGAPSAYLATMDDALSGKVLKAFHEKNIICITTKSNKDNMLVKANNRITYYAKGIEIKEAEIKRLSERLSMYEDEDRIDIVVDDDNDEVSELEKKLAKAEKQKKNKEKHLKEWKDTYRRIKNEVFDFEYLIDECKAKAKYWDNDYEYSSDDKKDIAITLSAQIKKHASHDKVLLKYADRINKLGLDSYLKND